MEEEKYEKSIFEISLKRYENILKNEINLKSIPVLYEDNHIIVVIKPAGIASQKDENTQVSMIEIIKGYLKEKYNKKGEAYLGLVHRLDVPTTGIMVFAKTSKAASRLSTEIQKRNITKKYLVVVKNILKTKEGVFKDMLIKNAKLKKSFVVNKDTIDLSKAKNAELEYTVLGYNHEKNLTLVSVRLITGRHHQIRVQFSNRGYPVLHDSKYDRKYNSKELGLYSYYLEFKHPTKQVKLIFKVYPKNINLKMFEGFA